MQKISKYKLKMKIQKGIKESVDFKKNQMHGMLF